MKGLVDGMMFFQIIEKLKKGFFFSFFFSLD